MKQHFALLLSWLALVGLFMPSQTATAQDKTTTDVDIYGARTMQPSAPRNASGVSAFPQNVPFYTDNFDGANDTTALKNRGYKIYYRGTGPQGTAPIWFQGNTTAFSAFNGPANGYVASNFQTVTGANDIDNWLVLPALDIQTGDSLVFWSRSPDASTFPDSIRVMYSAAGDSVPEATTWTELGRFKVSTAGWERRSFGAPSAGSTGRFAIRYAVANGGPNGANSDYIGIDALTVERIASTPTFVASPTSVNFGSINVGGSSAPQSISLGNAGQGTLTITGVSLTGADASQFTLTNTNTLPANLGAAQNITVSVTFNPTSAGAKSASLEVTYTGATGSPATIPLTGTGFVPAQVAILLDTTSATNRASRDSLINYLNATGKTFDVIHRGGNTATIPIPSLSPYQFVFLLGEGTNTASPNTRTALKNYLQNGTPSNKARLIIFAEDFGYNHDRTVADARDTILTRELLGVEYLADRPASGAAQRLINVGLGIADSVDGSWPDVFRAVRPNTTVLYRFAFYTPTSDSVSSIGRNEAGYTSAVFGFDLRRYRAAFDSPPLASESVGAALTRLLESAVFYAQTGVALPVELISFTGEVRDGAVHLSWRTASELNNAGFEVERKSQGGSWNTLGFVRGAGTTTEGQSYTFVDNSASGVVQYRLKQVDFDGRFEYSNVIEVNAGLPKTFELSQNYPNPFNPTTVIAYQLPVASEVKLEVYDVLGRKVMTLVNGRQDAGSYNLTLNASNLASGVYFYRLQASATNGASSSNFVATKKMMLVK